MVGTVPTYPLETTKNGMMNQQFELALKILPRRYLHRPRLTGTPSNNSSQIRQIFKKELFTVRCEENYQFFNWSDPPRRLETDQSMFVSYILTYYNYRELGIYFLLTEATDSYYMNNLQDTVQGGFTIIWPRESRLSPIYVEE